MDLPKVALVELVANALREDLGRGDVTTHACVDAEQLGSARIVAREPLVAAGHPVLVEVFSQIDPAVEVTFAADGTHHSAGAVLGTLRGPARSLLSGERVALNFVQRLCGIATLTRSFVSMLPAGSRTRRCRS